MRHVSRGVRSGTVRRLSMLRLRVRKPRRSTMNRATYINDGTTLTLDATPDMATTTSADTSERSTVEERGLQEPPDTAAPALDLEPLIETLEARTTGPRSAREVRAVVEEVARWFENATVRDFLSVLILKEAADQLRSRGLIAGLGA